MSARRSRGIEVAEHLLPGEADDIPPPPLNFRPWIEQAVRKREAAAFARGVEQGREESPAFSCLIFGILAGALSGAGFMFALMR